MLSFWETKYFVHYDYIIIGSGIVGLTTAYYMRKKFPKASILILERGLLPTGASTKNAGFACMGSPSELLDDLTKMSEHEVAQLFQLRKNGLERLRTILTPTQIGYEANGSYELISANETFVLDKIEYLNNLLQPIVGKASFKIASEKISSFQFNTHEVNALIENTCEGEIDTGLMMKNLLQLVSSLNIEIKTGCEVVEINDLGATAEIRCQQKRMEQTITFKCERVFICTNAFAKSLMPELEITPGRGQVLITKPILNLSFKGIFHWQQGYYYFRTYQNRVLFGGGRNLDFEKETSTKFELNDRIQNDLIVKLKHVILPNYAFEIEQQWAGIMAFGSTKQFILKKHSETICMGVRMNGMGIAIGSEVGFQLSNL
jgi:gamma-glutamylputrescine oxidase